MILVYLIKIIAVNTKPQKYARSENLRIFILCLFTEEEHHDRTIFCFLCLWYSLTQGLRSQLVSHVCSRTNSIYERRGWRRAVFPIYLHRPLTRLLSPRRVGVTALSFALVLWAVLQQARIIETGDFWVPDMFSITSEMPFRG